MHDPQSGRVKKSLVKKSIGEWLSKSVFKGSLNLLPNRVQLAIYSGGENNERKST